MWGLYMEKLAYVTQLCVAAKTPPFSRQCQCSIFWPSNDPHDKLSSYRLFTQSGEDDPRQRHMLTQFNG